MDEKLEKTLRKINRQLRAIKVMLGFFSLLIICMFILLGFIAYKVVSFTRDAETKITNIESKTQQTLDLKSQLCSGGSNIVTQRICE
jgi:uncharacterized membrane protein SpoIIM required for sporulation